MRAQALLARRFIVAWTILAFALGAVSLGASPAAAQAGPAVVVDDGTGDVVAGAPDSAVPAPQSTGMDLVEASVSGETGNNFILKVVLDDMAAESQNPVFVSDGIEVTICFDLGGVKHAAFVTYRPVQAGLLGARDLGVVSGDCNPNEEVQFSNAVNIGNEVELDFETNSLVVSVNRHTLGEIAGSEPPTKGTAIGGLYVMINDGNRLRFDQAGPSSESLTLALDTANQGSLLAFAEPNVAPASCEARRDFPTYAIEAGGVRGVPITIHNMRAEALTVNFDVATVGGLDWGPRMLPSLGIPPSADEGNTTVTVIVTTPSTTAHKDCTILRVAARTEGGDYAEAGVIVQAVQPPSPTHKRLYMHTNSFAGPGTCSSKDTWLNTLENDPDDAGKQIFLGDCRNPDYLSTAAQTLTTGLDVNPNHDLVINTSAAGINAVGNVRLLSEHAPTTANIVVTIQTFEGNVIGQGEALTQIGTSPTDVTVPILISFTRDLFPDGDPSRVILSDEGIEVKVRYIPLPPDPNLPGGTAVTGRVYLLSDGTYYELPVADTIKRNANDPGEKGGLLSLRPDGKLPEFAAPGQPRLLKFVVLNEGPDADRALLQVNLAGVTGWEARVVPGTELPVEPGVAQLFTVVVTPRAEAEESETAIVDVIATSERDPTARASIATKLQVTKQEGIVPQEQAPDIEEVVKDKGLLPGPSMVAFASALAAAVIVSGRRRHA